MPSRAHPSSSPPDPSALSRDYKHTGPPAPIPSPYFFRRNLLKILLKRFGFFGCGGTLGPGAFGVSVGVAVGPFDAASACFFAASSPWVVGAARGFWPATTPPAPTSSIRSAVFTAPLGLWAPAAGEGFGSVAVFVFGPAGMVLATFPYWPPPTVMVKRVGVLLSTTPAWLILETG
jgi:hypothetical protein